MKIRFILAFVLFLSSTFTPLSTSRTTNGSHTPGDANAQVSQTTSSDAPTDWLTSVQNDIQRSEYAITWQDQTYLSDVAAAYQAPNRVQNLRTYFTDSGIRVIPRQTQDAP